jgi:hypothetical protein
VFWREIYFIERRKTKPVARMRIEIKNRERLSRIRFPLK